MFEGARSLLLFLLEKRRTDNFTGEKGRRHSSSESRSTLFAHFMYFFYEQLPRVYLIC